MWSDVEKVLKVNIDWVSAEGYPAQKD